MNPAEAPGSNGQGLFGTSEEGSGRRWLARWRFVLPILVFAFVLNFIRLPYFVFEPGPAQDVIPLIHVEERQIYPTQGHFLLTAVSFFQPNVYEIFRAWVDSTQEVVPQSYLLAPGQTQEEETRVALSQMDTSKIDAAVVALAAEADYPDKHGTGALVETVYPDTPAEGKLFAGDLILAIDGEAVNTVEDVGPHIQSAGVGHALRFTVEAGGVRQDVEVAPAIVSGSDTPIIGVRLVDNFPFPVTIDSGGIGGPSAGLMWALGLTDILTPRDLTGGRTIAGTGTIDPEGKVGPIGGIEEKVAAAERAGAVLFFAPKDNAAAAKSVAGDMVIVPVQTYQQALDYLSQQP
jgi:PDZ domain-containing protein